MATQAASPANLSVFPTYGLLATVWAEALIARDLLLRDCAEQRAHTGAHGIALDVEPNPLKLPLLTNLPAVALFLPERTSCSSQHRIGPLGCNSFQGFGRIWEWDFGSEQWVKAIRHHREGV